MDRRTFVKQTSLAAFAVSSKNMHSTLGNTKMGIVVHSYAARYNGKYENKNYAPFANALQLLNHCNTIGAGGIQTIINDWQPDFTKQIRESCESKNMWIEGSVTLPKSESDIAKFENNIIQAAQAGAHIVRTVCLGTRRYETFKSLQEFESFKKNALASIYLAEPILKKQKVKLAVENHKDWKSYELASLLKSISSEWIGATLDFGNNLALLEEPMEVLNNLAPFAISTHVKDMAVSEYEDGFLLSEVPLGQGTSDLKKMVTICKKYNPDIRFSLEMITRDPLQIPCKREDYWATFGSKDEKLLNNILSYVQKNKFKNKLPTTSDLSLETKLSTEETNNIKCLEYSRKKLKLK